MRPNTNGIEIILGKAFGNALPPFFRPEAPEEVYAFHRTMPDYHKTPLVRLKGLAAEGLYKYRLCGAEYVKSGAYLMNRGLDLPLRWNFDSLIVELEKLS
jgi:hypothetical protein